MGEPIHHIRDRALSLVGVNRAPHATFVEKFSRDLLDPIQTDLDVLYIGYLYSVGASQRSERRFPPDQWTRLVYLSAGQSLAPNQRLARVKEYLSSMRKVVALQELDGHITCLAFYPQEKVAVLFDTFFSQRNLTATAISSRVIIFSLFGQEDWELQTADIGPQDAAANNCAFHSILRARRELLNQSLDTSESEAAELRRYAALSVLDRSAQWQAGQVFRNWFR